MDMKRHLDEGRRESGCFFSRFRAGASHLDHNLAALSEVEKLDQKKIERRLISLRRTRENSSVVAAVCLEIRSGVCVCLRGVSARCNSAS